MEGERKIYIYDSFSKGAFFNHSHNILEFKTKIQL